jgi:hypothetical protein
MSNQRTTKSKMRFTSSFPRCARFGLACCALVAFYPGVSAAQSEALPRVVTLTAPAQQFLAAVRANFAAWDRNHDGQLTREEIELDMQNPRITGDGAAALAALKVVATHSDHLSDTRSYGLADFDAMEQKLQTGQKLDPNFVAYFSGGLKKLKEVSRQLFSEGIPRLTAIRQDWTSDCYFLSAAGALAQANPQAIVRLVASNSDGSFTVSFPGKPAMRLPAPTDTEIATYSNARDGVWLSLLEKACNQPHQSRANAGLDQGADGLGRVPNRQYQCDGAAHWPCKQGHRIPDQKSSCRRRALRAADPRRAAGRPAGASRSGKPEERARCQA